MKEHRLFPILRAYLKVIIGITQCLVGGSKVLRPLKIDLFYGIVVLLDVTVETMYLYGREGTLCY